MIVNSLGGGQIRIMNHEKIFSRADGSRIKIIVSLSVEFMRDEIKWDYSVLACEPRKRTWRGVLSSDDYEYRKLPIKERGERIKREYLNFVTKEEIISAQTELWEKLKPA